MEGQRHRRSRILLMTLIFLFLICMAVAAQAQTFKVGSFTKRTGAAPGSWVEVRE